MKITINEGYKIIEENNRFFMRIEAEFTNEELTILERAKKYKNENNHRLDFRTTIVDYNVIYKIYKYSFGNNQPQKYHTSFITWLEATSNVLTLYFDDLKNLNDIKEDVVKNTQKLKDNFSYLDSEASRLDNEFLALKKGRTTIIE